MESLGVTITDEEMLKTLGVLMDHTPSLVVTVGFNDLRWVCVPHAQQWMMKTSTSSSSQPESYLRMNIWCNLDGETNPDVLHECCSSVLGHILTKPGIAQVSAGSSMGNCGSNLNMHIMANAYKS
jgi:hypothetical protein